MLTQILKSRLGTMKGIRKSFSNMPGWEHDKKPKKVSKLLYRTKVMFVVPTSGKEVSFYIYHLFNGSIITSEFIDVGYFSKERKRYLKLLKERLFTNHED